MSINSLKNLKNDVKMDAKITLKSSRRHQKDVKNDRGGPRDATKPSKWHPRGAKLDLLVFYRLSRRPQSPGGMHRGALITYRLGRLTELNITLINLLCTVKKQTAPTLTRTGVPAGTVRI